MKSLKLFLIALVILCCSLAAFASDVEVSVIPVDTTSDGAYTLVTNNFHHGLALVDNLTGKAKIITDGRNAGYYATISPNQQYVCYKAFLLDNDTYLQTAMIYDIARNKNVVLTDWLPMVGTPAVALDGTIAYTIGDELFLVDAGLNVIEQINLGYHVNLLNFSDDSSQLTFNDANGQIIIFNRTDKGMRVVDGVNAFWGPKFSPQGDKIMAPTVNGYTAYVDAASGEIKSLTKGQALGWVDNDNLAILDQEINEKEGKVTKSKIIVFNTKDSSKEISDVNAGDAVVALKGHQVAIARDTQLELGNLMNKRLNIWANKLNIAAPGKETHKEKQPKIKEAEIGINAIYNGTYSVYLTGMPYIHQVYDTANNFNGHSACGATSALMAIQYYSVLPTHPITVSTPTSHTSNYGWYISNVYTKGRTFNIYGADPNGNMFAGGFGYIIQNNWADTKGHMRDYIQYHGRGSSVDWSPYFSEMKTEIDGNHPFVVLTSLTSAGHYITCRGYYKSQYSGVFNDPYGNKNSGYMNYSGSLVAYDWPGYNNGYSNLTTVHCFIYCR